MELQNLPWYGQLGVFLLIGGLLFGIFYFAYYSDEQSRIGKLQVEIDGLEKEIRGLERKKAKVKEMQAEVEQKKAVLVRLKEILPEEKEISQIIKKIQSIITTARLEIQKWKTNKPISKRYALEHPIDINLNGNFHNLGLFFDQVSRLKKIFTVNKLVLNVSNKMTRAFTVRANFTISTYTFKKAAPSKKKGGKKKK